MTATRSLPEAPLVAQVTPGLLPRPSDGTVNLRGPLRQLAEPIASETMGAGADQTRAGGNGGSGHRERRPATCVGTPAPRVPRPGGGSFFPKDAPVRHQGVDRAPVATAAETCATGTSTRKARGIASKMGTGHLPEDWAGAIARDLDAMSGRARPTPRRVYDTDEVLAGRVGTAWGHTPRQSRTEGRRGRLTCAHTSRGIWLRAPSRGSRDGAVSPCATARDSRPSSWPSRFAVPHSGLMSCSSTA